MPDTVGLHLVLALGIALPLMYAGATKLVEPAHFVRALPRYNLGILAPQTSSAVLVATFELAIAGSLMILPSPFTAISGAAFYMVFAGVLLRARLAGARGDCGCFGALAGEINATAIARNVVWALLALALAFARGMTLLPAYDLKSAVAVFTSAIVLGAAADTLLRLRADG